MRSGFVAIAGKPNAGKSTLINALVGEKVAIVSSKPQTTRSEIRGIYTDNDCQIIFTDTPGLSKPRVRLESRMNQETQDVIKDVDLIYLVVDASKKFTAGDQKVLDIVKSAHVPVFLILNKTDKMDREEIVQTIGMWQKRYDFAEYFPISAMYTRDLKDLIETTASYLPEGGLLYPVDQITDDSENFRIAEMIREKIYLCTQEEVPHASAVVIENKEFRHHECYIQAVILVEKEGQKGIMIGKGGQMLKKIGTLARKDIEKLLGMRVYLELFVRVEDEWRSRDARINEYGYGGANRD